MGGGLDKIGGMKEKGRNGCKGVRSSVRRTEGEGGGVKGMQSFE